MPDITLGPPATPAVTIATGVVGPQGPPGPPGPKGPPGPSAATVTNIFRYRAKAPNTSGDPGLGHIRWNYVMQVSSTELAIDIKDQDDLDVTVGLRATATGSRIYLQGFGESVNFQDWTTTGPGVDRGGYWTFPVALTDADGTGVTSFVNGLMLAVRITRPAIPVGGTTGQVLRKLSDADNDFAWTDP